MDLNTILIILGAIAVVILVVHGIWLNRQNKSKVFDNEDPMKSATDSVDLPTDGSAEMGTVENENFSQNAKDKETSGSLSAGNFVHKEKRKNIDEQIDITEDNTTLNADLSHITISLRDKPSQTDKNVKLSNDLNDNKSSAAREQIVQTKKKDQPKDIEMPSMPKNAESDENTPSVSVDTDVMTDEKEEKKAIKETPEIIQHVVDVETDKEDELPSTNIAEESLLPENETSPVEEVTEEEPKQDTSNVIMLYVVAPDNSCFKGSDLHQALDKEGFLFGAQSIFHRHSEFNCHSPILFSLANLDGPGEFNPENMESMRTFGVAIFMETPVKYGSARTNLRFMINSAKALARDLGGYLLSDKQEPFTFDVEQEYLSRVF
ncbi:hypothetical protein A6A19_05765 [Actinobacillus delphinicola]|uniref:cell division protein ZipA n=1 Tax=Actinobacillus delphinicola TaxID=51161 RepID=UPI0024431C9C|nr:cell division protein ZipA [Actinobacillus delphinicola]MDG6897497.1 hypothetical protein [Actinobacillus delphinicola]